MFLDTEEWRPIIAAVARCAWLDEAYETKKVYDQEKSTVMKLDRLARCEECLKNAAAWAAWGREK